MEFGGYLRFLLALVFVIGLIGLLAMVARRMGFGFPAGAIQGAKTRRLWVGVATALEGRRRGVLIRRVDTEHLILMGPTSELLIESGIKADAEPPMPIEDKS